MSATEESALSRTIECDDHNVVVVHTYPGKRSIPGRRSHPVPGQDSTRESVILLDDDRSNESRTEHRSAVDRGITFKNRNPQGSTIHLDSQDHDYSGYRSDLIGQSKLLTQLLSTEPKKQMSSKQAATSRMKNIDRSKKLTPDVKIVSPEVADLSFGVDKECTDTTPQLKNYCRTCAGLKVPLVDIFSEKGIQMRLNQQMKHLEEIDQQDGLSTQMCMDCICDLKMSYKFFMQIKKAQVKLRSINSSVQLANGPLTSPSKKCETQQTVTVPSPTEPVTEPEVEPVAELVAQPVAEPVVQLVPDHVPDSAVDPMAEDTGSQVPPEVRVKAEPEMEFTFQLSDDESIEEFDPEDPPYRPENLDFGESEGVSDYVSKSEEIRDDGTIVESPVDNDVSEIVEKTSVAAINTTTDPTNNATVNQHDQVLDFNKMVYQYNTDLKAYVKVEQLRPRSPPPLTWNVPLDRKDDVENNEKRDEKNNKKKVGKNEPATGPIKSEVIEVSESPSSNNQPNILKRKISLRKDLLVNSGTTPRGLKLRRMNKPKLDVENAVNVTKENEEGIMYVTVKGTKPNELLLVKVKKMEKTGDGKSDATKSTDRISQKIREDCFNTDRDKDNSSKRVDQLDLREKIIADQIEEYKKKREQILGGRAWVANASKPDEGTPARCVDPVESAKTNPIEIVKPDTIIRKPDEIRRVVIPEGGAPVGEKKIVTLVSNVVKRKKCKIGKSGFFYNSTGEYLSRLAKLKRKWEEAKKKKESLRRELAESYNDGNVKKLGRILGERKKNVLEFQEYLKQRKIVITRMKDEEIISLYEDRNNESDKKKLPDLIDSETPADYIESENYLECDYCPESFAVRELLEEHLKTHDYKLTYYCEDCHEEFSSVKGKRNHNGNCMKKLICRYCDAMLDSKGKKRQHEQKHLDSLYGQLCDVCGEKFKHQGTLDQHLKTQHMTWEKVHECPKCPKKFAFKQKLSFHLKSVHTSMRAYLCEDCGADFKNPASLRHHRIRKHHPTGNKRECPVCNKLVPFYSLSKHMYTHKAYTIQCPHCDKMFKNTSTLKQHLRIHEDQRQYRCDTCGVGFNRRDGLKLHMRVHQKSDSRSLKECSCQICSEKFPNHSMLVIHRNRVHKDGRQFTCHICNRSMLSTRSLEWHMSHIHNAALPDGGGAAGDGTDAGTADGKNVGMEKKRVSCVHCDKTFKTEMILRTHIKNTHVEKDPTKCLDCELTFTSDVRLRHHMMVAHNRLEGTLACPHCPKRFVNQLRLKTHMISHSEDRPYTCEICGFNLKTKIQLIKHHQNRHSDERPLQCRYCPWRCKQVSALVCHERTHTNERPYSCVVCRQRFKYLGDKNKHERRHESLGGSGFKRIVAGRNLKQPKSLRNRHREDTSTSDQDQIDYDNQDDEEQFTEQEQDGEKHYVKLEHSDGVGHQYEQSYQQEYEETSRETSEAAEVIMNMEDTTVYTEEVTADNVENAEIITDEIITNEILQSGTVVHLQQQDDTGKIQVIPVMLSLPDLSGDSSAEVNLATASIMYNN